MSEIYEFDWYSAVTSNCWQFSLKLLNNSATDNWQLTTVCPTISNYSTPNIIMIILLSSRETCLLVWCSVQTYIYNCIVFSNPLLSLSIVHCALTVEIQVFLFRLFLETRIVPARFVASRCWSSFVIRYLLVVVRNRSELWKVSFVSQLNDIIWATWQSSRPFEHTSGLRSDTIPIAQQQLEQYSNKNNNNNKLSQGIGGLAIRWPQGVSLQ